MTLDIIKYKAPFRPFRIITNADCDGNIDNDDIYNNEKEYKIFWFI